MSRLANWMMRLYPARWRARYGDELGALLSDTGADVRIVGDLFRGGMRMQLKTWPFLKLAFALGLLGLLLGTGIAQLLPSEYTSRATLQMQPAHIDESTVGADVDSPLNERIQELQTVVMSRTELSRIIRNLGLYPDLTSKRPLEDVTEDMRHNITVSFVALKSLQGKRASVFDIRFNYSDPYKAQQTVTALIAAFEEQNQQQSRTNTEAAATLLIVDPASLPQSPFFPKWSNVLLSTFLAGVVIAGIWRLVSPKGLIRRRFALVTLAMGVSGLAIVGAAGSLRIWPSQYLSTGTLIFSNSTKTEISAITNGVLSRTSLSTIINDPHILLYRNEQQSVPLEDVIEIMTRHISIREIASGNGTAVVVSFEYPDRYKAQRTVSVLMNRFAQAGLQLHGNADLVKKAGTVLDVLDNASLPVAPTKPNRYLIAFFGGVFGIILAATISLIRRRWKPQPDFPATIVPE